MSLSQKDLQRADALKTAGNPDATLKEMFKGVSSIVKSVVDKVIPDDPKERADKEAKAYINASNTASKVGYGLKRTVAPAVAIARGAVKGTFSALKSALLDKPSPEAADALKKARDGNVVEDTTKTDNDIINVKEVVNPPVMDEKKTDDK